MTLTLARATDILIAAAALAAIVRIAECYLRLVERILTQVRRRSQPVNNYSAGGEPVVFVGLPAFEVTFQRVGRRFRIESPTRGPL